MKHKCTECGGTGEVGESPDGQEWWAVPCSLCKGYGETERFVRLPLCDKRISNGDDFAGDCWFDQVKREYVYGAVGRDRNAESTHDLPSNPQTPDTGEGE